MQVLIFNMPVSAKQEPCPCPKSGHMLPMECEPLEVRRGGSMYFTRADNHLYRLNRPLDGEDNKGPYLYDAQKGGRRASKRRLYSKGGPAGIFWVDHKSNWLNQGKYELCPMRGG